MCFKQYRYNYIIVDFLPHSVHQLTTLHSSSADLNCLLSVTMLFLLQLEQIPKDVLFVSNVISYLGGDNAL